jgi:hypothetical protein
MKFRFSVTCSALRLHPLVIQDTYELFYPLIQSPESSSATRFTTTTASSADPLPIAVTSLLRLGFRCRSYNVPAQVALHRVRSITLSLPTHLLYSEVLRKGYGASVVEGTSPSLLSLPEVRTELEWQFWLRLPSDSSLALIHRLSLIRQRMRVSFRHPCLRLYVASFQGS